ncbi:hypothetical protein [Streptomyces bluensis]|uniref:Uncharacterized protein n=1 Tax=Streptomyces bluensis TaxID=33897 RepID=A0ABW6UV30_9ACTN
MSDSVPDAEAPEEGTPEPVVPEPEPEGEPAYDPAAPAPLGVPRTPTGNADVDAALDRLGDADHLGTDGHVEVYEDVHGRLRDALTALDARPGPPAPGRGPSGHTTQSVPTQDQHRS